MNAITHTPAEKTLIDLLDGAQDWRASARKAVIERGLPTRRAEAWKWSDLRKATQGIETRGEAHFRFDGETAENNVVLRPDGRHELSLTASPGVSVAAIEIEVPAGVSARVIERQSILRG